MIGERGGRSALPIEATCGLRSLHGEKVEMLPPLFLNNVISSSELRPGALPWQSWKRSERVCRYLRKGELGPTAAASGGPFLH